MNPFKKLRQIADSHNEANDCSVIALAAACRVSYEAARSVLEMEGRKPRNGVKWSQIERAAMRLNCRLEEVCVRGFIESRCPKGHHVLKSITTHHAARFPGAFEDGEAYLLLVRGGRHVAAVADGVTVDWTEGTSAKTGPRHCFFRVVSCE